MRFHRGSHLKKIAIVAVVTICCAAFSPCGWGQQTPPNPQPAAEQGPPATDTAGHSVQPPAILREAPPKYPALARQARVQGTVVLHATIGTDGKVKNLSVVSGHPFLCKAAMDAVRQWRYQPTLVDGKPIEVELNVSVTFTLDKKSAQESPAPQTPPTTQQSQDQVVWQSLTQDLRTVAFPPELLDAGAQAKEKLRELNVGSVLVTDFKFSGDDTFRCEFEDWLADGVAQQLVSGTDGLKVYLEREVNEVKTKAGPRPDTSHIDGVVEGTLSPDPAGIRLTLTVFRRADWLAGDANAGTTIERMMSLEDALVSWVPMSWRKKAALDTPAPGPNQAVPAGAHGVGVPACIHCPDPNYAEEARSRKCVGTIVLQLIVTTEGNSSDIKILRRLGYGLDEAAVAAVSDWKFRPALDQEGHPVSTIVTIEVSFRLI